MAHERTSQLDPEDEAIVRAMLEAQREVTRNALVVSLARQLPSFGSAYHRIRHELGLE